MMTARDRNKAEERVLYDGLDSSNLLNSARNGHVNGPARDARTHNEARLITVLLTGRLIIQEWQMRDQPSLSCKRCI